MPAGLTAGPCKIVLADSGLPGLDDLTERIRIAHAAGRPVAVHSVTREALVLLLAALDAAGRMPGDRVEHAALVPAGLVGALRGLRVVTQPGFLADRGDDYLRNVPESDHDDLYRCRSLLDAGVPVALSSDAPYGPLDPWLVMAAAARRRTPSGAVIGPGERLPPEAALAGFMDGRRVAPGERADLLLLKRPLSEQLAAPTPDAVRAVMIAGVWVSP
jgi:predicted amidohydrolase YtcJ